MPQKCPKITQGPFAIYAVKCLLNILINYYQELMANVLTPQINHILLFMLKLVESQPRLKKIVFIHTKYFNHLKAMLILLTEISSVLY